VSLPGLPGLRRWRGLPKIGELKVDHPALEPMPRAVEGEPVHIEQSLEDYAWPSGMGTLPERIILKWLMIHEVAFEAQWAFGGGRRELGGAVIDFVVYGLADRPIALRVMGEYWHGQQGPNHQARDDAQAARLRADGYLVVDLWEEAIYRAALGGWLDRLIRDGIAGGRG
jgi:hypothetical protein